MHQLTEFADGINNFVEVNFEPTTKHLYCTFPNEPLDSVKQCNANITYGANCDQQLGVYSTMDTGVSVAITSVVLVDINEYCVSVTASSSNKTVIVEGRLIVVKFGNEH